MTLGDLLWFAEGVNSRDDAGWQQARFIAYTIAAANRDTRKPFPKITRWFPLPSDEEDDSLNNIAEQVERYKKKANQLKQKLNGRD